MKSNWSRRELEALGEPINPVLPTRMSRMAGGGGKGSAPAAPDYEAAAIKQGQASMDAIRYQTQANRPNQITPFGNQTWTKEGGFDQAGYDKAMEAYRNSWVAPQTTTTQGQGQWMSDGTDSGNGYWDTSGNTSTTGGYYSLDAPNRADFERPEEWTQTTTLAPEAQAALDSQLAMQRGRSDIANSLMPMAQEAVTTPIDYSQFSEMGATPGQSNFQAYNTDVPTMNRAAYTPQLQNMSTVGQYRNGVFTPEGLSRVQGLRQAAIPNTPEFNEQYVQDMFNKNMEFMRPDMEMQQSNLEAKLAAQGVGMGSKAWETAQRRVADQQYRNKTQALNNAFGLGSQMYQNQLAGDAQNFNQQFTQNKATFDSQLAKNMNDFNQQNQTWNNNMNLQNNQFNQNLAQSNFNNQTAMGQNSMNLANLGFNNQAAASQFGMQNQQIAANNQIAQQQFAQQQQIANYQNQLRQQQIAEAQMRQLQPLNNINALLTGQQVSNPAMPAFNTAGAAQPTNYLGAANAQGNYNMMAQQMNNASSNSLLGGAFGLGGQLGAAYMLGGGLG